jgi:hypothetical protein
MSDPGYGLRPCVNCGRPTLGTRCWACRILAVDLPATVTVVGEDYPPAPLPGRPAPDWIEGLCAHLAREMEREGRGR